jgi:hypothetical protein
VSNHKAYWSLSIRDDQERMHAVPDDVTKAPPIIRGYWVDEEVMKIAGIESSSIIMKMKWADAVRPSHIAIKPKGRKRAWSARNVLRALITAELARLGRMSFLAAAKIIGAAYVDHLDRLLHVDAMLQAIEEHLRIDAISDTWFAPIMIENPAKNCMIVIDDWSLVSWSREGEGRQPLARILALEKKEPEVRSETGGLGTFEPRVTLTIPLEPMIEQFLSAIASKKQSMG